MSGNRAKPHGVMAFSSGHSDSFGHHDGPLVLERLHGEVWTEVARFATMERAASALDELASEGVHTSHLRISPLPPERRRRWSFRRG